MKCVHILRENRHPHSWLPSRSFTKKNLDLLPGNTTKCRRIVPVPFLRKTQAFDAVVPQCGKIPNIQNRNHTFKLIQRTAPVRIFEVPIRLPGTCGPYSVESGGSQSCLGILLRMVDDWQVLWAGLAAVERWLGFYYFVRIVGPID
jgi:hypothetical protein